jgi:hypothetical protein
MLEERGEVGGFLFILLPLAHCRMFAVGGWSVAVRGWQFIVPVKNE